MSINQRSNVEITFDSVNDILEIVNNSLHEHWSLDEKKEHVQRNVDHLKIVKTGTYVDLAEFTNEQKSQIDASIAIGESFVTEQ